MLWNRNTQSHLFPPMSSNDQRQRRVAKRPCPEGAYWALLYDRFTPLKRLVWAHNLLHQVIHVAARWAEDPCTRETVNKRAARHGFIV